MAEQFGNHVCRRSLIRQTLPEVMTEQHGYLVRLVYPGFTQLVFEAHNDFGYRQASSIKTYKQWLAGLQHTELKIKKVRVVAIRCI